MAFDVRFRALAIDDLATIGKWLSDVAGGEIADDYVWRLRERCSALADYPRRGTPHPARGAGMRSIPFRRGATIHYRVEGSTVEIVRILRAGRDPDRELGFRSTG